MSSPTLESLFEKGDDPVDHRLHATRRFGRCSRARPRRVPRLTRSIAALLRREEEHVPGADRSPARVRLSPRRSKSLRSSPGSGGLYGPRCSMRRLRSRAASSWASNSEACVRGAARVSMTTSGVDRGQGLEGVVGELRQMGRDVRRNHDDRFDSPTVELATASLRQRSRRACRG